MSAVSVEKKVNGHQRPPMPVLGEWRAVTAEPVEEQSSPQPEPITPEPAPAADVEAVRARAWAEAEERRVAAEAAADERRIIAQAEADAIRAKAEEDARKARLANDRAERKAAEDQAASEARIAEHQRRRDAAERARHEEARQAEQQQTAAETEAAEIEQAENRWRGYARSFYIVCAIVALPVQVAAFYNPRALWLMAAPLMLEGGAWVVLKGAAAAVAGGRPHWHYRLIAWLLAFIAAGINLWHGMHAFDPATAIGTAFASVAGPGVWDLHEHGRIRKRDGKPTWRERRAQAKAAKTEASRLAAEEARKQAEKEAADKAAAKAAEELAAARADEFPKVWEHACRLAAALGETTVTETVWRRAHLDIEGAEPGESAETIRARNVAAARVESARTGAPVNTLSKTTNAQRAIQTPRSSYKPVPPRRKPGDTPRYDRVAGRAHSELLKRRQVAKSTRPNAD